MRIGSRFSPHQLPVLLMLGVATAFTLAHSPSRAAAADATAEESKGDDRLTGRWIGRHEDQAISLSVVPDGRYFFTFGTADAPKREAGRCRIDGGRIKFTTNQGKSAEYELSLKGEQMTLTSDAITLKLDREAGSQKTAIAEVEKHDAEVTKENAEWAKRFPLGKLKPQPNFAVGDLPKDPHPQKVFAEPPPTVFATHVSYVRYFSPHITYRVRTGADPGGGKAQTVFHFLPNGRFFYRSISYDPIGVAAGDGSGTVNARVTVVEHWGKYRVAADAKTKAETLTLETDAGEELAHTLSDGRRNLLFGGDVEKAYGEVTWELYALQRGAGQDPKMPPVPEVAGKE